MQNIINLVFVLAQAVVGGLIIFGILDIKAIAWYWILSGILSTVAFAVAGALEAK